jgi:hypothetical protein
MLFTENSLWTMIHGIAFGGGALLGLGAALFAFHAIRADDVLSAGTPKTARSIGLLTSFVALMLWLTVIAGTYIVFPTYRETPPEGATDLLRYPRAYLLGDPDTAWLHAFAMETKEHVPWIAAMVATAIAFVAMRYRATLLSDRSLRRMTMVLLAICFLLVAYISLLGVFINKVAPVL